MNISIVGGINYDITINSLNQIIPFDSNPSKINYAAGGVGRNIAEVLGKVFLNENKISINLFGFLGDDPEGSYVIDYTKKCGVNCENIIIKEKNNTGKYITFNNSNSDMYVAANDMEIYNNVKLEEIYSWLDEIKKSDILILDTNISIDIINKILENITSSTLTIIETVSMNKIIKLKQLDHNIDILKTNMKEFNYLYNTINEKQILDKCKIIKSFHDIIITNGNKDVLFYTDENLEKIKITKSKVINTNGAGDSFLAGFLYGIVKGYSKIKSIMYGNIFSNISLSTNQIFPNEINDIDINNLYRRFYNEN